MAIQIFFKSEVKHTLPNSFFPGYLHDLSDLVEGLCSEELETYSISTHLFSPLYDLMENIMMQKICTHFDTTYTPNLIFTELHVNDDEVAEGVIFKILVSDNDIGNFNRLMFSITQIGLYGPTLTTNGNVIW